MDTNKLVKAAEQASMEAGTQARLDNKGRSFIGGIIIRAEARAATVAVMRALADDAPVLVDGDSLGWYPETLREYADVIEEDA